MNISNISNICRLKMYSFDMSGRREVSIIEDMTRDELDSAEGPGHDVGGFTVGSKLPLVIPYLREQDSGMVK